MFFLQTISEQHLCASGSNTRQALDGTIHERQTRPAGQARRQLEAMVGNRLLQGLLSWSKGLTPGSARLTVLSH
jgi:hypothetical protein